MKSNLFTIIFLLAAFCGFSQTLTPRDTPNRGSHFLGTVKIDGPLIFHDGSEITNDSILNIHGQSNPINFVTVNEDINILPEGGNVEVTVDEGNSFNYNGSQVLTQASAGVANGLATLDGGGKIPAGQLPNSVMTLEGQWNATTNTPALTNGIGNAGMVYEVTTAGTHDFGSGSITFEVGDFAVYGNDDVWYKSINSNEVVLVNGYKGIVELEIDDIPNLTTGLAAKANDSNVVHKSGNESGIAGDKSWEGAHSFRSTGVNAFTVTRTSSVTNTTAGLAAFVAECTGDMVDGFGASFAIQIKDAASSANTIVSYRGIRANNSDTTGSARIATYTSGTPTEYFEVGYNGIIKPLNGGKIQPGTPSNGADATDKTYVDGLDAANVKKLGNQTGIGGDKSWTGKQKWESSEFHEFNRTLSLTTGLSGSLTFGITSTGSPNTSSFGSRFPLQVQGTTIASLGWRLDGALNSGALLFMTTNAGVENTWATLDKAGKMTFSGSVEVPAPSANANPATKLYTDTADALKANIASPTLTGDPKAPTPTAGDNDTSIATTAFVADAVNLLEPSLQIVSTSTVELTVTSYHMIVVYEGSGDCTMRLPVMAGSDKVRTTIINKTAHTITINTENASEMWVAGVDTNTTTLLNDKTVEFISDGTQHIKLN